MTDPPLIEERTAFPSMSTGCSIYFTPESGDYLGTPEFIRGLAAHLGLEAFDSLRIYHEAPTRSESRPHPEQEADKLLEVSGPSVEEAIAMQRADIGHTTIMSFGTTGGMKAMFEDITATLPGSLSEGFAPTVGDLYNGPWKHYDYNSGEQKTDSECCLILSNNLGYPVDLDAYLEAFLKVPSVIALRTRLEELSGHSWRVLIDLT